MATVRKRKWTHNGQAKEAWVVEYTDQSGKRRRITPQSGLKRDADKERLRVEKEIEIGQHVPDTDALTFGEVYSAWLADCERRWKIGDRMSGNGYHAYEASGRLYILPTLQNTLVTKVTPQMVQNLVNEKATKFSNVILKRMVLVIAMTFKFALRERYILSNPIANVKIRLPDRETEGKGVPTKEDLRLLLMSLKEKKFKGHKITWMNRVTLVTLALFAGMRRGEILGLQWENVDLDKGEIRVAYSLSDYDGLKAPKSKAGRRIIPMSSQVRALMEWLKSETTGDKTGYIVQSSRRGYPLDPSSVSAVLWNPMMRDAGLMRPDGRPKFSAHSLRHAAASLLIEQGLDAFVLKGIMGHSSVQITYNVYGHLFPSDSRGRKAIESAAATISDASFLPCATDGRDKNATT